MNRLKQAEFYSLRVAVYNGPKVVAVTKVNGKRWYGRYSESGVTTNGTLRDLVGQYETENSAYRAVIKYHEIVSRHEPAIRELDQKIKELRQEERRELRVYLNSLPGSVDRSSLGQRN